MMIGNHTIITQTGWVWWGDGAPLPATERTRTEGKRRRVLLPVLARGCRIHSAELGAPFPSGPPRLPSRGPKGREPPRGGLAFFSKQQRVTRLFALPLAGCSSRRSFSNPSTISSRKTVSSSTATTSTSKPQFSPPLAQPLQRASLPDSLSCSSRLEHSDIHGRFISLLEGLLEGFLEQVPSPQWPTVWCLYNAVPTLNRPRLLAVLVGNRTRAIRGHL